MSDDLKVVRGQMKALDHAVDHVRGAPRSRLIVEYGDYECPYSRLAYREIEAVERRLSGAVRFAFRHFPLVDIHLHALAASAAAEAAARQGRFWEKRSETEVVRDVRTTHVPPEVQRPFRLRRDSAEM